MRHRAEGSPPRAQARRQVHDSRAEHPIRLQGILGLLRSLSGAVAFVPGRGIAAGPVPAGNRHRPVLALYDEQCEADGRLDDPALSADAVGLEAIGKAIFRGRPEMSATDTARDVS